MLANLRRCGPQSVDVTNPTAVDLNRSRQRGIATAGSPQPTINWGRRRRIAMPSWIEIALILLVLGLLLGVGVFVQVGKVILIVVLALFLVGLIANMLRPSRRHG